MEKENFVQYLKRKGLELKEWWNDPKTQRAFSNAGIILGNSEYPRPGTGEEWMYSNAINEKDPEVLEKQNAILTTVAAIPASALPGSQHVYGALGLTGIVKGGKQYIEATKNKDEKAQNDAIALAAISAATAYTSGVKLPKMPKRAVKVQPKIKEPTKNSEGLFILEKNNPNPHEVQTPLYDGYPGIYRSNITGQETAGTTCKELLRKLNKM